MKPQLVIIAAIYFLPKTLACGGHCENSKLCQLEVHLMQNDENDVVTFEFFLNVFPKFREFSDKNICYYSKRLGC